MSLTHFYNFLTISGVASSSNHALHSLAVTNPILPRTDSEQCIGIGITRDAKFLLDKPRDAAL